MFDAKPPKLILVAALSLLVFASATLAQNDSSSVPNQSASPSASKTRPRQVTNSATEKSATQSTEQPQKTKEDQFSALRDEIAAATAEERAGLQFKLVDQLVAAGMKQEAIAELQKMRGEDRFDPKGFFNIGNALARLGDADGAIDAYRKAIDQRKGNYSRALNNLGVVLLRAGRWDDAYDALVSALRIEKFRYAEASYNLGRAYAARGETELAQREWRRALVVDPEHAGAAEALGNPAGRRAGNPSARVARPGGANELPALSKKAPASKASARDSASRTVTVDPETFDLLQWARSARERGRNEDAAKLYRTVLSRMGGYFAPANLELGYVLSTLKRNDEAIASLLPVAARDDARYKIVYYHLGRFYELKGDLQAAVDNYTRAAAAYGDDNAQFLLDVSRTREKLGDLSGALAALERYIQTSERQGRRPDWSDERLAQLRQKIAAASAAPAKP